MPDVDGRIDLPQSQFQYLLHTNVFLLITMAWDYTSKNDIVQMYQFRSVWYWLQSQ